MPCGGADAAGAGACGASGLKIAKYYLHPFEAVHFLQKGRHDFLRPHLRCVFCQNYGLARAAGMATMNGRGDLPELRTWARKTFLSSPRPTSPLTCPAFELYRPNPVVYNCADTKRRKPCA
ncbi:MAG: hypothetical protein ACLRSW_14320 [Christensenellaceae bacterium]